MGDQIGKTVEGSLYFLPKSEFDRILIAKLLPEQRSQIFANMARLNTLYMIAKAGSGHMGSCFSSLDLATWLHLNELNLEAGDPDLYYSSKGHDAPALYSIQAALGYLPFEMLHKLRRLGGLPGHPDVHTPGAVTNTGSLGMGVSKAKGFIQADRLTGRKRRVFVMTGDGELQEGQFWESLVGAVNEKMGEITIIIDHNKIQSDTWVSEVSDLGDLEAKLKAYGLEVARCDGHDHNAIKSVMNRFRGVTNRPKVLIADTVKGHGISFMAYTGMSMDDEFYKYHSGAPKKEGEYKQAAQELIDLINDGLETNNIDKVELEIIESAPPAGPANVQLLTPAYTKAFIEAAEENEDVVALDADLILDCGLIEWRDRFPERFFECGIAEMDMVSQAGTMARSGLIPVAHSFACFLTTRANDQIYNNASEKSKVIYFGGLAGVLPGGPGHSHQSVRDISAIGGMPGLVLLQPCCEKEVKMVVDYCIEECEISSYIRMVPLPLEIPYELPSGYKLEEGKGAVLKKGKDAILIGYSPSLLPQAFKAAEILKKDNINLKIVHLPWLNRVDGKWLKDVIGDIETVFTLDDHYVAGGQGQMVAAKTAELGLGVKVTHFGLHDIPECGTNDEVLKHHGLDAETLATEMKKEL